MAIYSETELQLLMSGRIRQQLARVGVGVRALERGTVGAAALHRARIGIADRPDRNLAGVRAGAATCRLRAMPPMPIMPT